MGVIYRYVNMCIYIYMYLSISIYNVYIYLYMYLSIYISILNEDYRTNYNNVYNVVPAQL